MYKHFFKKVTCTYPKFCVVDKTRTADSEVTPAETSSDTPEDSVLLKILSLLPPTVSDDGKQYVMHGKCCTTDGISISQILSLERGQN